MKKFLCLFLVISFIALCQIFFSFYRYCVTPYKNRDLKVSLHVPRGSSLNKISLLLEKKGLIEERFKFKLLAKLKNAEHKIKSGEYSFSHPASPLEILDKLIRGEVKTYSITIPEGSTIFDIAREMENAGLGTAESVLKMATDVSFVKSLGIDGKSLEGYLFPDTYSFTKGTKPDEILKTMTARFKEVFVPELKGKQTKTVLSEKDIIILASLIEKETARKSEKPVVAAVFLNRLKKRMRLECDPTVIYGLKCENPGFNKRLRKKHLKKKTPYNTYRIYGLPPGPICNPGLESIKAVLNPAKTDYLYFVSKNDGTHKFSRTFKEHNKAVYSFQKRRKLSAPGKKKENLEKNN